MQTVMKIKIPQFYSVYARELPSRAPDSLLAQYHCEGCGADFRVKHRQKQRGGYYWCYDDDVVICPHCGRRHVYSSKYGEIFRSGEKAPVSMTLQLDDTKSGYVLRAREVLLRLHDLGGRDGVGYACKFNRVEEFHFDVRNRKTMYYVLLGSHRSKEKEAELGDPFEAAGMLYETSMLWHLRSDNMAFAYRPGGRGVVKKNLLQHRVDGMLKMLRDGIRRKWMKYHGYDLGGLFVPPGKENGRLLFPLVNLAWRLIYPDAKNLDGKLFGKRTTAYSVFMNRHLLACDGEDTPKPYAGYLDFKAIRKAGSSVQGVIDAYGLPGAPCIRRLLQDDIFRAEEIRRAYHVMGGNLDLTCRFLDAFDRLEEVDSSAVVLLYNFFDQLAKFWPAKKIVGLVEMGRSGFVLRDIRLMFVRLSERNCEGLSRVKPRDLHDWLAQRLAQQDMEGYELNPPEAVVRRLQMQLESGGLNFFVPRHTVDLHLTSKVMHNCVKTYDQRMKQRQCYITLMTDDNGRLLACLEVRNSSLVQAKLRYNKPVREDSKVNGAVVSWCERAGLEISTRDVRKMQYPMVISNAERVTA